MGRRDTRRRQQQASPFVEDLTGSALYAIFSSSHCNESRPALTVITVESLKALLMVRRTRTSVAISTLAVASSTHNTLLRFSNT